MGSKPKPYKPSAEEQELQARQMEEIRQEDSELAEQKYKRQRGGKRRSLVSYTAPQGQSTLGAE